MKLKDLNQPAIWLFKAVILGFLIASFFSCKAYEDSILTIIEIKPDSDTVICTNLAGKETIVLNPYNWNIRIGMSLKEVNRISQYYYFNDIINCDSINFE